jgi:UDP-N-acetylglucosamine 4,6-dehydratase
MRLVDLARVIAPDCKQTVVGIRPGEKLHEVMIPVDDGRMAVEYPNHFIIKPSFPWWERWHAQRGGKPCADGFYFGSDNNSKWVTDKQLARMIAQLDLPEAREWAGERGLA